MGDCAPRVRAVGLRSRRRRGPQAALASAIGLCLLLIACGGSHPSPTRVPSAPRSVASSVITKPAKSSTQAEPSTPARSSAAATRSPSRVRAESSSATVPTSAAARPTTSAVTTTVRATATRTQTASAAPSSPVGASPTPVAAGTSSGGTPAWVWWLVALLGLGLGAAVIATAVRHHRRTVWSESFTEARTEVHQVAETLLQSLASQPPATRLMQDWQAASARVMVIEDKLARLEATAPDAQRASRVRALRDASVSSRIRGNDLLASTNPALAHAELFRVASDLDKAAARAGTSQPAGPG